MTKSLKIGTGEYDRITPFAQAMVSVPGYELAGRFMPVTQIPGAAWGSEELDVAEVAMGQLLEKIEAGDDRYLALPVFPSIAFRHDSVFARMDGPVKTLADIPGARIGTTQYFGTTTIWIRALLEEQYGLDLSQCSWTIGPLSKPAGDIRRHHAESADVGYLAPGDSLEAKLDRGELDVILSYVPPRQTGSTVRRLIDDLAGAEREWMGRFNSAPLLHVAIVRKSLLEADPALATGLVDAFIAARDIAVDRLGQTACLTASIPFLPRVMEEARALMGGSIWPCGAAETRTGIELFHDLAYRQGLTSRRIAVDDCFYRLDDLK